MELTEPVNDSIEPGELPCTTEELTTEHGDVELELPNGAVTLSEVFEHMPTETFRTREDVRLAVCNAMGEDAIGRKGYSDRDPSCLGEDGHDHVSL